MPKFYISNTEALLMQVEYFVSYDRPHFYSSLHFPQRLVTIILFV